ncbi:MAG: MaoC/PaaZ C-terminal domain-containing protein [Halioglobus sp.]|nr:MaoC/PaaZ C-terminal domain-containing protein [Halioglobus sp.]
MDHASYPGLTLDRVSAGDELPELRHEVSATTVILGALASRDWRPMHHDRDFAQQRNGTRDIFMNTPNQAAWLERYITDWAGPRARIGRYKFRMGDSICPGDTIVFSGEVQGTETDDSGCGWALLSIALSAAGQEKTRFSARVALPVDDADNPWSRTGDRWRP